MRRANFVSAVVAIFITAFFVCGCSDKKQQVTYNKDMDGYIESISPFSIGRMDSIAVSFTEEPIGKADSAIKISPETKGEWKFTDRQAVFTPSEAYEGGSQIILSVDCRELFGDEAQDGIYKREFVVRQPEYKVKFNSINLDAKTGTFTVSGVLTTDIEESRDTVESMLTVKENGSKKSVEWKTAEYRSSDWAFSLPVVQGEKAKNVEISWSGKKFGVKPEADKMLSGTKKITFPKKGELAILDIDASQKNSIAVSFSAPLDEEQYLPSLITFYDKDQDKEVSVDPNKYKSYINGNILTLYTDSNWGGSTEVSLSKGIKSKDGALLERSAAIPISGTWDKPEIRFANDGVILPSSKGTIIPVETKNLQGLLIQAYAIENRNMNQFLQVNELDGANELYRVGEPVWEKKVFFKWEDSHKDTFITRGLDLTELVGKYPKGMFQIRVSFRHDQIMYHCNESHGDFSAIPMPPDTLADDAQKESSWWDYYNDMDYETRRTFWYYDNDPCHPAYYMPRYNGASVIKRNILVSDLALMAKLSASGKYYATVTDMKTAAPVKNAEVALYSFTGKTLEKAKTDENGNASFSASSSEKAYVMTASDGTFESFLKISGGTMLSTSHFEVGGEVAENGVKGAIYGERGVWRPGDDIYLTFVLQDLAKTLPANIPLNFTLTNPLGATTDTQVFTESVDGFYAIKTKTFADAPTGNWTAKVKIGGKEWSKALKIETVVPNRLAVNLESDKKYLTPYDNSFTVSGSWLHGAPIPEYKADVSVLFSAAGTSFEKFSDYTFTNPERTVRSDRKVIWSGNLGADSTVKFTKDLNAGSRLPGKLKANFITRIFEPSNAFSTQSKSIEYSPYTNYVGLKLPKGDEARNMLLTDTEHTADLVLLDADGNPVKSGSVDWSIYKLSWKWWWEKDAYTSATYVNSDYTENVGSGSAEIKNGRGSFKFEVKYPQWGRYFIVATDSEGHSAGKIAYIDWPGWAGRAQEDGSGSASMVAMVSDKKNYTAGETAEISFTANESARALVTIEKSGEVYRQEWVETKNGTTVYKLPLSADMAPNVYVHLTLLQPHGQTENSLPIRLYGVIPVRVDDPATKLSPVVTTPKSFQPNGSATISVSEKNGRPMTYTLAVVDEGLLGITNFHSPNLRSEFYKKEASLLQSWDLYKYVMSAYSGKLETLLAIGGSEDIKANDENDENRFKPVVKFFGPYTIQAGEKKSTTFQMPEYIGAVRAMVIAGHEGAYGTTEKTVEVKSDIMVQPSLPRTIGTDEEIMVPVTVFNNTDERQDASVALDVSGAVSSSYSEKAPLEPGETKTLFFKVATKKEGPAVFKATASNGKSKAKSEESVEVKSRGIPVSYRTQFTVQAGKSGQVSVSSPTEISTTELTAEISTFPQISLDSRLSYLTGYPHGCIEQITSGGFPQLYLPEFTKLSKEQIEKIKENVNSVIKRYPKYQTNNKTFGYWPGSQRTHEWGTCYASHFMVEARNHGYSVPHEMLDKALDHLEEASGKWSEGDDDASASTQAYRLFVLALAGRQNLAAMNRLLISESLKEHGDATLLLAASYAQSAKKADTAKELLKEFRESKSEDRNLDGDFNSTIRQQAITLFTYNLAGEQEKADSAAKRIAETLASDKWLSTQETAWSLFSLIPFYTAKAKIPSSYEITANGEKTERELSGGTAIETLKAAETPTQSITVANKGDKMLFGTLTAKGMSKAGTETEQNSGIRMVVSGLQLAAEKSTGESVEIQIQITNTSGKDLKNIALTVPVPTGFEFANERLSSGTSATDSSYQDFRDDAIYTYFDLKKGGAVAFSFNATLAYKGEYVVPAIHAEAMYDNEISAVHPGFRIKTEK